MIFVDNSMRDVIIVWQVLKIGWPVQIIAYVTIMGHGKIHLIIIKSMESTKPEQK